MKGYEIKDLDLGYNYYSKCAVVFISLVTLISFVL